MRGDHIIVDGLWRCLCPSWGTALRSGALSSPSLPDRRPTLPVRHIDSESPIRSRRSIHRTRQATHIARETGSSTDHYWGSQQWRVDYIRRIIRRSPWVPAAVLNGTDSWTAKLKDIPTQSLYTALQEIQHTDKAYFSIVKLAEYLVLERGQKPNAILYECLIRANVDKDEGSARVAARLFQEMGDRGITMTPQVYQALLEVTAVHPDYHLRSRVLFEMKSRWQGVSSRDQAMIALGLLRDGQYEMALAHLEEFNRTSATVPSWLFDIFIYVYGDMGFHQETFEMIKHFLRLPEFVQPKISMNMWHFLLEVFSRDAFYPGIKFVWNRSVIPGSISPPDGVVINVLNTASRHGDVALATSTIELLSIRGRKLDLHHYEALVHAHVLHQDLQKAFAVFCIMGKAGLSPDLSSTRPIYRMLRESASATDGALEILNELRQRYDVPSAALNVVLEATVLHRGINAALDLYRSVRRICAQGPDAETYETLLPHCSTTSSMKFLFAEMLAFSIKPTAITSDHLVRLCTMQEDYDKAFRYLEMIPGTGWISRGTALGLIRRCIHAGDPRVERIIQECRRRDMDIDVEVRKLVAGVRHQSTRPVVNSGKEAGHSLESVSSYSVAEPAQVSA